MSVIHCHQGFHSTPPLLKKIVFHTKIFQDLYATPLLHLPAVPGLAIALAGFTAPRSSVLLGSGCYGRVSQTERLRNNTHVFRAVLGAGRQGASTVKFPRGPSSGSWTADFAFFTCHREGERALWGPFYKSTNPICGGSLLMT